MCTHVWENRSSMTETRDYYCHYAGHGLDRELFCPACGENGPPREKPPAVWLCEACFMDREDSGFNLGDWGVPGYRVREGALRLATIPAIRPADLPPLAKIVPLATPDGSRWLALTETHDLLEMDLATGQMRRICGLAHDPWPIEPEGFLVASAAGDFAVAAPLRNKSAEVVDLASGTATMRVHIHENGVFSATFFRRDEQTLLVCATDWNRLDVFDPGSGKLLTGRELMPYKELREPPPHFLDYFHSNLAVSPGGEWIADDGWMWGGFGVVRTWNLRHWLTRNVWESEDGASVRTDVPREMYNGPLCWVGPDRLAVWGVGDARLLPAVRIFNVASGDEFPPLIGPLGPTQPARAREEARRQRPFGYQGTLAFDEHLFAWSPTGGLSVWDLVDGARVLAAPELRPLAYHHGTGEFLSRDAAGHYRLSKLVSS
jgi:hypothetical protein